MYKCIFTDQEASLCTQVAIIRIFYCLHAVTFVLLVTLVSGIVKNGHQTLFFLHFMLLD